MKLKGVTEHSEPAHAVYCLGDGTEVFVLERHLHTVEGDRGAELRILVEVLQEDISVTSGQPQPNITNCCRITE